MLFLLITDEPVGAAPSGEIGGKSRTVLLEMLTDDVDDETTDIEFVTTPRTDSDAEPQEAEISKQEEEVEKPDVSAAPAQNKEAALNETTKDLLNESFEAMINIHRYRNHFSATNYENIDLSRQQSITFIHRE